MQQETTSNQPSILEEDNVSRPELKTSLSSQKSRKLLNLQHSRNLSESPIPTAPMTFASSLARSASLGPQVSLTSKIHSLQEAVNEYSYHQLYVIAGEAKHFSGSNSLSDQACQSFVRVCCILIELVMLQSSVSTTTTMYNLFRSGILPKEPLNGCVILINQIMPIIKQDKTLLRALSMIFFSNVATYCNQYLSYVHATKCNPGPPNEEHLGVLLLVMSNLRYVLLEQNEHAKNYCYREYHISDLDTWVLEDMDQAQEDERCLTLDTRLHQCDQHFKNYLNQPQDSVRLLAGTVGMNSEERRLKQAPLMRFMNDVTKRVLMHPNTDFAPLKPLVQRLNHTLDNQNTLFMSDISDLSDAIQDSICASLMSKENDQLMFQKMSITLRHTGIFYQDYISPFSKKLNVFQYSAANVVNTRDERDETDPDVEGTVYIVDHKKQALDQLRQDIDQIIETTNSYIEERMFHTSAVDLPSLPHPLCKEINLFTQLLERLLKPLPGVSYQLINNTQRHTLLMILLSFLVLVAVLTAVNLGDILAQQAMSWHAFASTTTLVSLVLLVIVLASLVICCVLYAQKKAKQRFQLQLKTQDHKRTDTRVSELTRAPQISMAASEEKLDLEIPLQSTLLPSTSPEHIDATSIEESDTLTTMLRQVSIAANDVHHNLAIHSSQLSFEFENFYFSKETPPHEAAPQKSGRFLKPF